MKKTLFMIGYILTASIPALVNAGLDPLSLAVAIIGPPAIFALFALVVIIFMVTTKFTPL